MRTWGFRALVAGVLLSATVACWISLSLSRISFAPYDVSPMVDSGWRVFSGQVPGMDFVVTFPPSLYLSIALGYHLFGVTWAAIAKMECLLYGAMVLLGVRVAFLLRAAWSERVAAWVLAAFATGQAMLLVSINFPWHASMVQSFGVYAVMAALVLVKSRSIGRSSRVEAVGHLTLALALLLLSKPNTAVPLILVCLFVCFRSTGTARVPVIAFAGALLLAALLLWQAHVTLWGMAATYLGLTGRLLPKGFVSSVLYLPDPSFGLGTLLVYAITAPLLTATALLFYRNRNTGRLSQSLHVLGAGAIFVSILGMGTNFDFKLTDTPLLLMGACVLTVCSELPGAGALRFRLVCAGLALLGVACYFGRTRYRMRWFAGPCATVSFDDRFLGHFRDCEVLPSQLAEVDRALQENTSQSVFLGPSLEYLYAGRGIQSPLHLPDWWDKGTSYPVSKEGKIVEAWEHEQFHTLVLDLGDPSALLPAAIARDIRRDYVAEPGYARIQVFRRR